EQELRQSEASIRSLYQVIAKQELNFQQRVNKMLQMGAERFGLELGILSKIEQEKYEIIAVSTPNPQSLAIQAGDIFDLSQTYCQVTVKSASQPVSFSQAKNTLWQNHPCYRQTQLEAYLGTTVIVAGEIYGTLNFSSRQPLPTPFKPVQAELIKLMAQWLGAEIERQQSQLNLAQARDEAEAASRAKSDFLATMSHEIRTPMNAVIGMTGLLLNTQLNEQQQDFVQTIRSSGDALLTLINDILDFSKIEAGKLEFEEQPFELHSCIEAALSLLAPQGIEKNLELAYLISPQTPKVIVGDVTRLRQILVNLISNAVKFTPQGEVVVYVNSQEIDKEKYEIEFAVNDTGIGIPPDKMDRLFQSFSQVDASTTRQYGGTGLGLAISQRLCQMMGGKMWVTSQVGVGSTFYFTIIAPLGEEATINQPQISLDLAGKKLLIVDDNATNRQILTLQAQNWGMLSCAVESGEKALHLLNQAVKFDLAILDMQMPGIDGVNLARKVRKSKQWGNLPLIMLTSLNRQEIISQSQDINFAAILNKPIQQNQLYRVISQVFGSKLVKINKSTFPGSALPEKSPQINSLRILLAEDIVVNQKVATLTLQQLGYRADVVSNGLEVLEALRRQTYDVVLMDVQMPEMDGITATKAIVNQYKLESRPRIIAMTANAMRGDKEKCLAAGMNDYIPKPIRLEDLKNALEKCQPLPTNTNSTIDHQTATTKTKQQKSYQTIDTKILDNLTEIVAGDQSLLTELIESYFTEGTTRIAAIKQAIEQNNPEQLTQAAHALKSASANVGAIKLSQMCRKLEEIGRSNT
ncbi:MAG: hybrid sensor histidine kinase/response regulator, partial [Cyanobacteria bacterium J083]